MEHHRKTYFLQRFFAFGIATGLDFGLIYNDVATQVPRQKKLFHLLLPRPRHSLQHWNRFLFVHTSLACTNFPRQEQYDVFWIWRRRFFGALQLPVVKNYTFFWLCGTFTLPLSYVYKVVFMSCLPRFFPLKHLHEKTLRPLCAKRRKRGLTNNQCPTKNQRKPWDKSKNVCRIVSVCGQHMFLVKLHLVLRTHCSENRQLCWSFVFSDFPLFLIASLFCHRAMSSKSRKPA